ncbi:MAG TPA: transposase, partial [Burkholderiales bacterium]|nr:transposase [Burkholderiales bacterium]
MARPPASDCSARVTHGGQQLAFWNAHQDERGFATMHINHVRSGTPIAAILRSARTPKGTEVRTVVKHVTRRLKMHWPRTRLIWRGDSHYGRNEVMQWCEDNGEAFIFGLSGNSVLVDIRYVATSLEGSPEHLYENVYCQRGQMENLIKLHKAQLASDRMSCHSATANQVRL